ncbi:hypothetical protein V8E53_003053 [Lactarius tabidus]
MTTNQCPLCEEGIQVGTAGPQGLAQHKGKKKCLANVKKKREDVAVAKKPTLFLYLCLQDSILPTVTDLAREAERNNIEGSSQVQYQKQAHLSTQTKMAKARAKMHQETQTQTRAQTSALTQTSTEAWTMLGTKTSHLLGSGPRLVAVKAGSSWTVFVPKSGVSVRSWKTAKTDELWENVNPGLDRILGFGRSQEDIIAMVCCSQKGLQGLYEYLEVLIEKGGIDGGLLEGKINTLITQWQSYTSHAWPHKSLSPSPCPSQGHMSFLLKL